MKRLPKPIPCGRSCGGSRRWASDFGAWWLVLGGWCEGAEVESRAAGGEEGEVNGQVPNGRDARWPSASAERARRSFPQSQGMLVLNRYECDIIFIVEVEL